MSLRPIDLNGMIQNTNDISLLRQNEDVKPEMQQADILKSFEDQAMEDTTRVKEQEDTTEDTLNPEEGNGTLYEGRKGRSSGKKKKKEEISGRVIKKSPHGSFSASI